MAHRFEAPGRVRLMVAAGKAGLHVAAASLLDSMADPAVILDTEARIQFANTAATRLWEHEGGLRGLKAVDLWTGWPDRFDSGATFELLHVPSGRWYEHRVSAIRQGLLVVSIDVHERRAREERNSKLFESSAEGILIVDEAGRYLDVNSAFCRIVKRPRQELIGRHFSDLIPPDHLEEARRSFGRLCRSEQRRAPREFPLVASDGSIVHLEWTSVDNFAPGVHLCICRDITERASDVRDLRQAEEQLRSVNAQLQAIIENSPLPIVILSGEGLINLWNLAAEQLFGWTSEEVLGRSLPFIPEEKADEHRRMRQSDLSGNTFHNREIQRRRKDGTRIDLIVSTALLRDADGEMTGILSLYSDITEQKRVQRELATTAQRLTLSLEASGMGDWLWDSATDLVTFSPAAARIFEIPPGPHMTWTRMREMLHPEDRDRTQLEVDRCLAHRTDYDVEYRIQTEHGGWRWVSARGRGIYKPDGEASGMVGVVQDITARRESQAILLRLHRREQEARQTAELLNRVGPALLGELDAARLRQRVVDLATELTGANFGVLCWLPEDDEPEQVTVSGQTSRFPPASDFVAYICNRRKPLRIGDIQADADHGPALERSGIRSLLAVPVTGRSGTPVGVLLFGHVNSNAFAARHERLVAGFAAQAVIALENARLFTRAESAARALREANEELRLTNRDLEHFAWSASHDLQEPLRQVATFSQLLERRYSESFDKEGSLYLDYIVQGARRMEALVRDILVYTNVSRAAREEGARTNANVVLEDVLAGMTTSVNAAAATVEADPLPVVLVKDTHVHRIFQNLLSNALKYRKEAPPRIRISAVPDRQEGFWQFSVSDNGIGIDPRYHSQIFGLFKRLHSSSAYEGTGIGLAICQKIVERYGGRIWVQSDVAKGSTFLFTLPGAVGEEA